MTIRTLLVANRGEIARRIFRTANAMGIETVAVFSDGDADAPFVAEANRAVALGGRSAADSYLDGDKVLAAAAKTGADAIHPGYGFLSENAAFASAVEAAGLIWVGPPPSAIAAMGDKLAAKKLMIEAGVPTLASVEITGESDVAASAAEIGYPVLVKAAAGGGGKGMRVVADPNELDDAIAGARREAGNSFGDDTVFIERYLPAPRHIEIQVLGDTQGTLLHCFERECSIQRRHQKVVEEAPSPAVDLELRDRMSQAAVDAVAAIGYYSAGTVEFLLDDDPASGTTGDFYFLEVNTRLQVEHPVTEEITGLDLVRQMIRVAEGHPLDVSQDDLSIDGHAIEVRLYAEDPANNFLPAVGEVLAWVVPTEPDARVDAGVEAGSTVSVEFDPMLAKVVCHAPTRTEAAQRLALVLERMVIAGVVTNRDFLVATLRSSAFLAGETRTNFIEVVSPAARFEPSPDDLRNALIATVLRIQATNHDANRQLGFLPSGYRNSVMPPQQVVFMVDDREIPVRYRSRRGSGSGSGLGSGSGSGSSSGGFDVWVDDASDPVSASLSGAMLSGAMLSDAMLEIDGVRSSFTLVADPQLDSSVQWLIQGPAGAIAARQLPRFAAAGGEGVAGGQVAPMPGVIRAVAVEVGQAVSAGETLVVMEAMKMEHTIASPEQATVSEVRCTVGDQVDNGAVLVVLTADSAPD